MMPTFTACLLVLTSIRAFSLRAVEDCDVPVLGVSLRLLSRRYFFADSGFPERGYPARWGRYADQL
jgi:hypothetical protein